MLIFNLRPSTDHSFELAYLTLTVNILPFSMDSETTDTAGVCLRHVSLGSTPGSSNHIL